MTKINAAPDKILFKVTLIIAACLIVFALFQLLASNDDNFDDFSDSIILFGGGSLFPCFFINLVVVFKNKAQRISSCVGCLIAVMAIFALILLTHYVDLQRRHWFLTKGLPRYREYVQLVELRKGILSPRNFNVGKSLKPIPFNQEDVLASTNSDGSLSIWFFGRGNNPRSGYLYYSGNDFKAISSNSISFWVSGDTNTLYRILTNKWFEF